MDWLEYSTANCSIQRTLEVIGERWTMVILREAFNGVRRFDQIRDHAGVSDSVLSDRLRKLVEAGVLSAVPYREPGRRARKEYRLTAKGLDLFPVLVSLLDWGDRYCADAVGPSVRLDHRECGAALQAVVQCDSGHVIESPRESVVSPGPGAQRL